MPTPTLPGLQFTAFLGQNETFATWKATQASLQREVDVRVLNAETPPGQAEHFLALSRKLSRLTHPGLAQIYDVITEGGATHVVMEHVEGASLAETVAGAGRLNPAQALRLALQLAEALDYAWTQARVVFRNLKPQNLRVNSHGILKIAEYGLAIQVKEGVNPLTADHGHVVGTPHYIAPEQVAASPMIDFRADMYALGTILYFLLTAKSPFEGLDSYEILKQQVDGQIPHPRNVVGQLPMPVCQFVMRLMMKQPQDRYAQWAEAIRDLRLLLANRSPAGRLPNAVSTIAPYAGNAAPVRIAAAGRRGPLTTADLDRRAPARGNNPFVLWLLLMLWFLWLANERLGNPLALPPALVVDIGLPDLDALRFRVAEPGEQPSVAPALPPAAPAATPPTPAVEAVPVLPAATAGSTTDAAPAPGGGESPAPASHGLAETAARLATGDVAGAVARLDALLAASPSAPGIEAIRDALKSLPPPLAAVEAGLLAQRGQEIVIRFLGRDRKILPRAIIDGNLQAEFLADDGTSRPVAFAIDKLDAAEKLRWLPEPQTPTDHAIVCLLALQAGDLERVRAHRSRTGALAPLFAAVTP
jgi:hypothetical protein